MFFYVSHLFLIRCHLLIIVLIVEFEVFIHVKGSPLGIWLLFPSGIGESASLMQINWSVHGSVGNRIRVLSQKSQDTYIFLSFLLKLFYWNGWFLAFKSFKHAYDYRFLLHLFSSVILEKSFSGLGCFWGWLLGWLRGSDLFMILAILLYSRIFCFYISVFFISYISIAFLLERECWFVCWLKGIVRLGPACITKGVL